MSKKTEDQFDSDIDSIALKLIETFGLSFASNGTSTSGADPLQRWMDFRLRYVEPIPRTVLKSNRFPVVHLPVDVQSALSAMESSFLTGADVNPYLSKTTIGNDVYDAKRQRRTDGLWADWGIHHFHLTSAPMAPGERFAPRSGWLLFAMVYNDVVALVDVREHSEADLWSHTDLMATFIDSWPEKAEEFRLELTKVESRGLTSQDYAKMRLSGVVVPFEHKGEAYFGPGGGVTSAVTSGRASLKCIQVRRLAAAVARWVVSDGSIFREKMASKGVDAPEFGLGVSEGGLFIRELSAVDGAWLLPRVVLGEQTTPPRELNDLLLPQWAVAPLMAYCTANP